MYVVDKRIQEYNGRRTKHADRIEEGTLPKQIRRLQVEKKKRCCNAEKPLEKMRVALI